MSLFGGIGRTLGRVLPGAGMGFLQGGPMGALIGGGLSLLGGGGGGGDGGGAAGVQQAMGASRQYLDQIPGVARQYYEPFAREYGPAQQQAQDIYGRMLDQYSSPNVNYQNVPEEYNRMARNPTGFLSDIMSSYSPSAGYQYKQNKMGAAARNSAASGGFAGTRYDQEQQAQLMKDLLGEDMQQYLGNVMGAKTEGMGGLERMMSGRERAYGLQGQSAEARSERAYNAANEMAQSIMNSLGNQGQLGYQGGMAANAARAQQNASRNQMFTNILGSLGGGGSFGGGGIGGGSGWFGGGSSGGSGRAGGASVGFSGIPHASGYLR